MCVQFRMATPLFPAPQTSPAQPASSLLPLPPPPLPATHQRLPGSLPSSRLPAGLAATCAGDSGAEVVEAARPGSNMVASGGSSSSSSQP
ncbi:hypothetical protein E2C01_093116 [Portunus trituberculatus]|uniref:Uncharacterized protein n=1 Tax=Portunus trituberculatus TaxID=210409 RepID=A0A5B7JZP5_PORTR|nr:hypothetical protein [Portunus trituberculatus]